jgi:hypothetical protein
MFGSKEAKQAKKDFEEAVRHLGHSRKLGDNAVGAEAVVTSTASRARAVGIDVEQTVRGQKYYLQGIFNKHNGELDSFIDSATDLARR